MTLDEIPTLHRHTWAVYEALRRLGFTNENITYEVAKVETPDGAVTPVQFMNVVLTAQDRRFVIVVHPTEESFNDTKATLDKLYAAIRDNSLSDDDLRTLWRESRMGDPTYFRSFTIALIDRGFLLPAFAN